MAKYEKIVQTYYEALEEGRILGRKCKACGHIEYPPYLACNKCGHLDTEWCEISGKAVATRIMPASPAFTTTPFKEMCGGEFCVASIQPEGSDEVGTCLVGMTTEQCEALQDKLPVPVRPIIVQDDGFKTVLWELDE